MSKQEGRIDIAIEHLFSGVFIGHLIVYTYPVSDKVSLIYVKREECKNMSIVANNSYRFNMSMDFWLLKEYTAKDLLSQWEGIIDFARKNESEENTYFLADCMDILYDKVLTLSPRDRNMVIDKANHDIQERIDQNRYHRQK